jgi:hypothetical protein
MATYYNMRLRKHMYINSSNYNQSETLLPAVQVVDFAIENICFRWLILEMLERVSKLDV